MLALARDPNENKVSDFVPLSRFRIDPDCRFRMNSTETRDSDTPNERADAKAVGGYRGAIDELGRQHGTVSRAGSFAKVDLQRDWDAEEAAPRSAHPVKCSRFGARPATPSRRATAAWPMRRFRPLRCRKLQPAKELRRQENLKLVNASSPGRRRNRSPIRNGQVAHSDQKNCCVGIHELVPHSCFL